MSLMNISIKSAALLTLTTISLCVCPALARKELPPDQRKAIAQLIDDGWTETARDQLVTLVKQFPKDAGLRFDLARTSIWLGDYETADKMSRKCIDLVDDNIDFLLMRGNILGSFAQTGSKIKALSRAKGCRKSYEKAVKLDPTSTEARESLMIFHLMAPGIVGGKQSEARKQADAISKLDPLRGHLVRAQILRYVEDDPEGARSEYLTAIDRFAYESEPCYSFARYLRKQKELDEAIRYQRIGITRDDDPGQALLVLATMLADQKAWEEAIEVYAGILVENGTNSLVKTHLSKMYFKQKNYDRAQDILTQIQSEDPDFAYAFYQEGVFLVKQNKDLEKAEADFVRYLNSRINQSWASRTLAQWRLAKVYEKQGRFTEAWEMAKTASESSPYSSFYKDEAKKMKFLGDDG